MIKVISQLLTGQCQTEITHSISISKFKNKMKNLKLIALIAGLLSLNACTDEESPQLPKGAYENGYFISNEGPFQNGTGSITFVGEDGTVEQNVYKAINGEDLGNIVNSISLAGDHAYMVVNNSNKIVVANRYTMQKIAVIEGTGIQNPRYFVANDTRAYVSNWGDPLNPDDDFISVIDLSSNQIISTIAVGEGPENMQLLQDKLYVTLEGGWSQNNELVIIDTDQNTIVNTIIIGDVPNSIVEDGAKNVWILCGGNPSYASIETPGALYKLSALDQDVSYFEFEATEHPDHLSFEGGRLYYNLNGKVYSVESKSVLLPGDAMSGFDGFYYALKTYNGLLFAADAKDFASEGSLKVFDLTSGVLLETITTGIMPGDIAFQ